MPAGVRKLPSGIEEVLLENLPKELINLKVLSKTAIFGLFDAVLLRPLSTTYIYPLLSIETSEGNIRTSLPKVLINFRFESNA